MLANHGVNVGVKILWVIGPSKCQTKKRRNIMAPSMVGI